MSALAPVTTAQAMELEPSNIDLHVTLQKKPVDLLEVKEMLDGGGDPNATDHSEKTVVDVAVYKKDIPLLTLLVKHKATTQQTKDCAFCMSALHGYTEIMNVLFTNGADINAQPKENPTPKTEEEILWVTSYQTALHTAARAEQQGAAELLLELGADPTITNHPLRGEETPAQVADTKKIKQIIHRAAAEQKKSTAKKR